MIGRFYRKYRLFVIAFVLAAAAQGCNLNCSVGEPMKISDSEAETIATKTLQSFNRSLLRGDFEDFHQTEVASRLKGELTTEKINQAFASFVARRLDIRPRDGAKINWSQPPAVDGEFLNLNGNYPAQSGQIINFKLQYVKDAGDWKIKAMDFNVS